MLTRTPPPVDVKPTPQELAREFCDMDSAEQGNFFVKVAEIVATEFKGRPGFESQMVYVANDLRDADEGWAERALEIMQTIGSAATL